LKLVDLVDRVVIDPRKLTHYALDPKSPYGKHKAVQFEKWLGFTKANYTNLLSQLEIKSYKLRLFFIVKMNLGSVTLLIF